MTHLPYELPSQDLRLSDTSSDRQLLIVPSASCLDDRVSLASTEILNTLTSVFLQHGKPSRVIQVLAFRSQLFDLPLRSPVDFPKLHFCKSPITDLVYHLRDFAIVYTLQPEELFPCFL